MELREFIKTTLTEIIGGVRDARGKMTIDTDGRIGSDLVHDFSPDNQIVIDSDARVVSMVEFDIVLARSDSQDSKSGIGVFLGSLGAGTQGASHGENSEHSRIKFSVPVVFPGNRINKS